MVHHVNISGHSVEKYIKPGVVAITQNRHSLAIITFVTQEIYMEGGKGLFCSQTLHSGMGLLDVVMLTAVLLTLVRGLTLP